MSVNYAGLMWSTAHREDRKTHVFIDPDVLPICNPGLYEALLWDYDEVEEAPAEFRARIESADADKLVCRSCVRILKGKR